MPHPGRPRALDEIKRREVCALVAAGCSISYAARYIGCKPLTIRREALRNEDFHEQLRQAELRSQLKPLNAMQQAAATHWRAAAWLLERTHPEQFARPKLDLIKPEQVEAYFGVLTELIAEEIDDEATRSRVYRRLLDSARDHLRQAQAAQKPRRDPRRARRFAKPLSALEQPLDQDAEISPSCPPAND